MRQKLLIAITAFVLGAAVMSLPSVKAKFTTVTIDTDTANIGQVIFDNYPLNGAHGTWEILTPTSIPPYPPTTADVRIVFDDGK
jgi:hypothetical protein